MDMQRDHSDEEYGFIEKKRRFAWKPHDFVEDPEDYQPGGFHPIAIGECFSKWRYRILHNLGHGGFSTVWLARDRADGNTLVALKAMRADASSGRPEEISSLAIPKMLQAVLPSSVNILPVKDHFFVKGPNGSHLFVVSPLAGPNILSMYHCPGRNSGSKRLRDDLARKVAKQAALAVYHMHRAGVVHGDTTTSNILFSLAPHVLRWSDRELYVALGKPYTYEVETWDGSPRPSCAPAVLVVPIDSTRLSDASLLQESIVLADFGQSYLAASPPASYVPATHISYFPPEARFENRAGLEADVWTLGCALFAIRAGCQLFDSFFANRAQILKQTIGMLGRLPDPWWDAFEERALWFDEQGEPKRAEDQAYKITFQDRLRIIGLDDEAPHRKPDGPMFELCGTRMTEEEVQLLGDLLEKILKYRPEERITMDEVIAHPWFAFVGSA